MGTLDDKQHKPSMVQILVFSSKLL